MYNQIPWQSKLDAKGKLQMNPIYSVDQDISCKQPYGRTVLGKYVCISHQHMNPGGMVKTESNSIPMIMVCVSNWWFNTLIPKVDRIYLKSRVNQIAVGEGLLYFTSIAAMVWATGIKIKMPLVWSKIYYVTLYHLMTTHCKILPMQKVCNRGVFLL
jgi:hypothetical protein